MVFSSYDNFNYNNFTALAQDLRGKKSPASTANAEPGRKFHTLEVWNMHHHSNTRVSQTSLDAVVRDIQVGEIYPDFWTNCYEDDYCQPEFEPVNSNEHDDRCGCPGCCGLCQDDYEFYAGTGHYVAGAEVEE